MRIVLLRHAIAEDSAPGGDAKRTLTAEGRKKAVEVCKALAGMELEIERILSSPLTRAMQTAQILKDALKLEAPIEECTALLPESLPHHATAAIHKVAASCVALVGHEPHISNFVSWSVGGGTFDVRKSGVVIIEGTGLPGRAAGCVVGMFAPRHLRPLI